MEQSRAGMLGFFAFPRHPKRLWNPFISNRNQGRFPEGEERRNMKLTTPEVLSLEYLTTYLDNLFPTMLTLSLGLWPQSCSALLIQRTMIK